MKHMQRINTDNKGFSLVELIVVVLIMGILAIGLTPQVLKWVNNARKASDLDYMHRLESAVQYALMDSKVNAEVSAAVAGGHSDVVLTVDGIKTRDTIGGEEDTDPSELLKKVAVILGFETDPDSLNKFRNNKTKTAGGVIQIHLNSGRAVGTYTVNGSSVDLSDE